jgi:hypothetical protein
MEPTEAEKSRAFRTQILLYVIMGVFILAPLVIAWLRRK